MEVKNLSQIVLILVLVGLILGVGVLILDKFGTAAKDSTGVVNEVVAISSNAGATANDDVTAMSSCGNATLTCDVFNSAASCWNFTTGGVIVTNVSFLDGNYNCNYTYDADSDATTVSTNTTTALSAISSTWLALIITIVVLAMILVLVIRSFSNAR